MPYSCKHCKKCFRRSSSCKQHERTHTGEKPYSCKYCKKDFSTSSDCKKHERTHTGEKPYSCKHCKKCFNQLSSCKRHEETQHAIDSSLKHKQRDQHYQLKRHLQESATTQGGKKDSMLLFLTEENSSQVEIHTCWICQKDFSNETCLIKHYDEHMR